MYSFLIKQLSNQKEQHITPAFETPAFETPAFE